MEDSRYLRDKIVQLRDGRAGHRPEERAEWLTFVVVGAGPTGVELVGQIAELAHKVLPREFRDVDTSEAKIILLEGAPSVLPPFHPKLQRYTQRELEKMGVDIRLNTLAVDMDHDSITVQAPGGRETIRAKTRIWAAGAQASRCRPARGQDRNEYGPGRAGVGWPGLHPARPPRGIRDRGHGVVNRLPGVAQPAMQEGKYVGKADQGPAGRP